MIELNQQLFPLPESQYANAITPWDRYLPASILAFSISIVTAKGNMLRSEDHAYFFSDSAIPAPRVCTVLAWDKIVRVGSLDSSRYILPFLPSLREDDEVGQAIAQRGSHVPSLSRRNSNHIRDDKGRINWGSIYIGEKLANPTFDSVIVGKTLRSNIVEALIVHGEEQHPDSAQSSIRERMEFFARYGVIVNATEGSSLRLPPIRKLYFRILHDQIAAEWALGFNIAWNQMVRDPKSVESDYKLMIEEILEARRESRKTEAEKVAEKSFGKDVKDVSFF